MILFNMPDQQIFLEMYKEKEKVDFAVEKHWNKILRIKVTNATRFPHLQYEEYTVPATKNRYLIWHYGVPEGNGTVNWNIGSTLLLNDDKGRIQTVTLTKDGGTRQDYSGKTKLYHHWNLCFYTGHFYSRYRERMHHETKMQPFDVIVTWLGRNYGFYKQIKPSDIIRLPERYVNANAIQMTDGIILGSVSRFDTDDGLYCEVNRQKTFLPLSMLKNEQHNAAESERTFRFLNNLYDNGITPEKIFR